MPAEGAIPGQESPAVEATPKRGGAHRRATDGTAVVQTIEGPTPVPARWQPVVGDRVVTWVGA